MNAPSDPQLLRDYAERRCEAAFAELVSRHIDLVHSTAVRLVNDAHLAKDVSQAVFVALAKDADKLAKHPVLSGWLHRTTRNIATQTVRTDVRRRNREQAVAMNEAPESNVAWKEIAPHLDAALGELSPPDRDAVLLRYFENKPANEMSEILGISAEAAQKRVSRAVEKLRENLSRRGITAGAAGLVGSISANAVQAAPVGLAFRVSSGVTPGVVTISKGLAFTTFQKSLLAATSVMAGIIVYQSRQVSDARNEVGRLREQVARVERKHDRTAGRSMQPGEASTGKSPVASGAFSVVAYGEGDGEEEESAIEGQAPPMSYISSGGTLSSALMRNFGLSKEQLIESQRVVSEHWRTMAAWAAEAVFRDDAASDADADGANIYRLPAMDALQRKALLDKFSQDLRNASNVEVGNAIIAGLKDNKAFAYMGRYDVVLRFTQLMSQRIEPATLKPLGPPQVIPKDANASYIFYNPKSSNAVLSSMGSDMSEINETFGNIFRIDE